ncbi:MAG TPA: hypothetical protein VFG55_03355 [Rhodanobacteraceae bacterium]|nr:hypothetical protein [Rhodanobacteraceae bacterium]
MAFTAWAEEACRDAWLAAPGLAFTELDSGRTIGARWPDGVLLDMRFTANGPGKCRIVAVTSRLRGAAAAATARSFWRTQFARLSAYVGV